MGVSGQEPTGEQIAILRQKVNDYIDQNGHGNNKQKT